ncbi:glycoside hydrolase domain-containing protein [Kitasatospora sp. NPDC048286]|uniref:glycoside hydrolase domain-containing protein n=1 Tax=Kitasatospora sp. NPDC048286 TaxID=3364047 RepID=UPI003720A2CC
MRARRALLAAASSLVLSAVTVGAAVAAPTPTVPSDTQSVTYLGHRFTVPADWQVVDLAADPTACVRLDRHAIYLGTPGEGMNCPSGLIGRTETLRVRPADAGSAPGVTADPMSREFTATAGGLRVTATYGDDEALVRSVVAEAGLPSTAAAPAAAGKKPSAEAPSADASSAEAPAAGVQALTTTVALPAGSTDFTGKGFDACTAPSSALMRAWKSASPYGAVGIYIGGAERTCTQDNLTADWVRQQAGDGWRFLPIYAGVQAPRITNSASQGAAAADDAVAKAQALGFGQGSLLHYDMENYAPQYSSSVLAFVSAWTSRLHERGYKSSVYSSSSSGIADIVRNRDKGYAIPDVLYYANWNGKADTADPYVPGDLWVNHSRVHQYSGDVTESWGGYTLNIDRDYLDVAVSGSAPNPQPTADPARVDFNGDGKRDIAGKLSDGNLLLWTGNGNGTLNTASGYSMWPNNGFGQVSEMVAADFNGDGKTDVAGKLSDGNLLLWSGTGNGTLDPTTGYSMWPDNGFKDVQSLLAGDFNGDGKADIAGKLSDGNLLLWTGNGNGTLNTASGYSMWPNNGFGQVGEMVAADFNGDGKTDIAGKLSDGTLLLWTGNGNGTLDPTTGYSMWPDNGFKAVSDLVAGDFNGDGKADIAGKLSDGNLLLWTGNGNGTLNTASGYSMWPDNGFSQVSDLL